MRGHQALIAMRSRGRRPAMVWMDTDRDGLRCWSDWGRGSQTWAHLQIDPTDRPALTDLRCIVGLTVIVEGQNDERVEAFAQACRDHGAGRVLAVVCEPGPQAWAVASITDTQEAAWPT